MALRGVARAPSAAPPKADAHAEPYLARKHAEIDTLFNGLLTQLIREQPDDPAAFVLKCVTRLVDPHGQATVETPTTVQRATSPRPTSPPLSPTASTTSGTAPTYTGHKEVPTTPLSPASGISGGLTSQQKSLVAQLAAEAAAAATASPLPASAAASSEWRAERWVDELKLSAALTPALLAPLHAALPTETEHDAGRAERAYLRALSKHPELLAGLVAAGVPALARVVASAAGPLAQERAPPVGGLALKFETDAAAFEAVGDAEVGSLDAALGTPLQQVRDRHPCPSAPAPACALLPRLTVLPTRSARRSTRCGTSTAARPTRASGSRRPTTS